jgi:hypothetical protein
MVDDDYCAISLAHNTGMMGYVLDREHRVGCSAGSGRNCLAAGAVLEAPGGPRGSALHLLVASSCQLITTSIQQKLMCLLTRISLFLGETDHMIEEVHLKTRVSQIKPEQDTRSGDQSEFEGSEFVQCLKWLG